MKLTYLAGWNKDKDAILAAIAAAADSHKRLSVIAISPFDFPETEMRTEAALEVAKHQLTSTTGRAAKRALIRGQYNWSRRYFTRNADHVAVCWNGITGSRKAFMDGASDAGAKRLFVERAPFPGRITLDPEGVNFAGSLPHRGEPFLRWAETQTDLSAWRAIGDTLTARASRRDDVGQSGSGDLSGKFLFCPLQVPNDSQVTRFGGWINGLPHMIEELTQAARALPDGWQLRCKEHPSAKHPLTAELARAIKASGGKLLVDNQSDTFAQVAASSGVVTLNSSVGMQAFFYDKPVIVLGEAIFGMAGLVTPARASAQLSAAFAAPMALSFDPKLRNAFMTYLDRAYFPQVETRSDGSVHIDPKVVHAKLSARSPL